MREAGAALVRSLHGLIGADALRHTVPGLTRRAATQIKRLACRDLERERRSSVQRVVVAAPGLIRGFDAMELCASGKPRRHALIAADGCVPYRTSWAISERYDGPSVAALLDHDFKTNGAPLVLRMDRASSHAAPAVHQILWEHDALPLHGPAHHARFYGQLERQNREHRAWLAGVTAGAEEFDSMMAALNEHWRRATLGWCTAGELWRRRPTLDLDRSSLMRDVHDRAGHLARRRDGTPRAQDLAWRLAVKQALVERGLLRLENGGWC
jgi:transposase InsO family protein